MTNLNDEGLGQLIQSEGTSLVYFTADWCGPCKILRPIMEKVEQDCDSDIKFVKADVKEAPETIKQLGIKNLPTCVLVHDGKEVARFSGIKKEEEIKNFLEII